MDMRKIKKINGGFFQMKRVLSLLLAVAMLIGALFCRRNGKAVYEIFAERIKKLIKKEHITIK